MYETGMTTSAGIRRIAIFGGLVCLFALLGVRLSGQTLNGSADVTFVTEDRTTTELDTVQINGVDSVVLDTVDIDREAITQEYSASLMRYITPWVSARASVRFYRTSSDQTAIDDVWREEFQPAGELSWNHPLFALVASIQHRESKGTFDNSDLIRDNITARLQSRMDNWPLMQLSYSYEDIYNESTPSLDDIRRDNETHRLEGRLEYNYNVQSFLFAASRRWTNSVNEQLVLEPRNQTIVTRLSETETVEWVGLARWLQSSWHFDERLRVNSAYTFRYQSLDDTRSGAFRGVSPRASLYANDLTPDQGPLVEEPALSDGNTEAPVVPAIDIGTGITGQNLGLEFGIAQDVSAVYVYTDRPSGEQVTWRVFTSTDNLTWSEVSGPIGTLFNLAQNRYEIVFPTVNARYIKVVNGGFNRFETVLITEIETFLQADNIDDETVENYSHTLDVANTYVASDELELSADFNFIREPSGSFDQTRTEYYFGGGAEYEPSEQFLHVIRLQRGYQNFSIGDQNQSSATYNYSFIYTPLDRLQFTAAAASLHDFLESERIQEANSVFLEASGTPFTDISMSTGISFSSNNRYRFGESFDSWTYRAGLDGRLSTAITGILNVSQQRITNRSTDSLRVRNQYGAGLDIRLSSNIFISGDVSVVDEENRFVNQDYTVSWNLSRRLNIGGLASILDDGEGFRTEQYDGRINLRIRTRANISAGITRTEFTGTGGFESTSIRVGFRSGF